MKIIFLDIDGVLNDFSVDSIFPSEDRPGPWALQSLRTRSNDPESDILYASKNVDEDKVAQLNTIIEKTGAKIVISSSWRRGGTDCGYRNGYLPDEMQRILNLKGFKGEVIGETPKLNSLDGSPQPRGNEIKAWLDALETKPTHIVILDDNQILAKPAVGSIENWVVSVNSEKGLTEYEANFAIYLLDDKNGSEYICCSICNRACSYGHSASIRGDVTTYYCHNCSRDLAYADYEQTRVLTTKLVMNDAIESARGAVSSITKAMKEIRDEVSKFDNEVWFNGLSDLVKDSNGSLKGKFGQITVMTYASAGRVLITIERADDYVTLIQADGDYHSKMGLQGIRAQKEDALDLISKARIAWRNKSLKMKPDNKVSLFW